MYVGISLGIVEISYFSGDSCVLMYCLLGESIILVYAEIAIGSYSSLSVKGI